MSSVKGFSVLTECLETTNVGVNPVQTNRRPLYLNTQSVPRSKHFLSRL